MEMKLFGLIETKLFNFLRILINGGQGGVSSGTPLDPPLLYVVSCRRNAVIIIEPLHVISNNVAF